MNYIEPVSQTLSEVYDDVTYSKKYYNSAIFTENIVDETHPDWDTESIYAVGGYAIVPALKTIYRNTLEANTGKYPPAYPEDWVVFGTVNSYCMFAADEDIGSRTTGTDMVIDLDFDKANSVVGIDLAFVEANLMQIDTSSINYLGTYDSGETYTTNDAIFYNGSLYSSMITGNIGNQPDTSPAQWINRNSLIVYNKTMYGKDIGCLDYANYYYTDAKIQKRFMATDMSWLPSSVVRITFAGEARVGTLCTGMLSELGCTLFGTKLRYESSSLFTKNPYTGFRTITRHGEVRILDVDVTFDIDDFNVISIQVEELIDKNIIWIPTTLDRFTEMITLGYIENFDIPVENPTAITTSTRIIGVNK